MGDASPSLSPATLGPRDEEYSLEQQEQLKQYFELDPYPDLLARRYLATRLHLTAGQVETWFIQHSMEKGMQRPQIQLTACVNSCPCAYHSFQGHRIRRTLRGTPSWRYRVLPINPSEPSTSSSWDQYPNSEEQRRYEDSLKTYQVLADKLSQKETGIKTNKMKSRRLKKSKWLSKAHGEKGRDSDTVPATTRSRAMEDYACPYAFYPRGKRVCNFCMATRVERASGKDPEESSQNTNPGLPETMEALKNLNLSPSNQSMDDKSPDF